MSSYPSTTAGRRLIPSSLLGFSFPTLFSRSPSYSPRSRSASLCGAARCLPPPPSPSTPSNAMPSLVATPVPFSSIDYVTAHPTRQSPLGHFPCWWLPSLCGAARCSPPLPSPPLTLTLTLTTPVMLLCHWWLHCPSPPPPPPSPRGRFIS